MQVQFSRHSYQSRALPASAQRTVNFYAEAHPPDAKDPIVMFGCPGVASWASGLAGALRGSLVMDGVLYIVAGNTFYSVDSTGAETSIGTINTSAGRVSMAHNDASPMELVFVDGTDGWEYDTTNGLVQITDPDFVAADVVTFQDGYFIFNRSGTAQFFLSNLNNAGA